MQIESTLFFETVEEIYSRVYCGFRPEGPLPAITVRFRKYTNATSRVRLQDGRLEVSISDLLQEAPAPIQEALATILIAKLFRKPPERGVVARYHRYINRPDIRGTILRMKRERGRKFLTEPAGRHYHLNHVFEELNFHYFGGLMARPQLGWSVRPSRTILGHYDPSHHVIVISSLLDSTAAPVSAVRFVMFHEMLHLRFPTEHRGARRCVHTVEFKRAEQKFEEFAEAKKALREFLGSVELGAMRTAWQNR